MPTSTQFLVHAWSLQLQVGAHKLQEEGLLQEGFEAGEDIELFLVNYIRTRRNPLSVCFAVLE